MSYLALTEIIHFITTSIVFAVSSYLFGIPIGSLSFLGAFFIDGDHMFDYILYTLKTKEKFSIKTFFKADFFKYVDRLFLPLHSWELTFGLIAIYFLNYNPIFLVLGFSMFVHLVVDQLTNDVKCFAYFLTYRAAKGFSKMAVCKTS
ncbi:hypothetical protein KBG31_01705 [Patescibacteria group bacterium]|nr:hypothetical protein [Patescibacteria group bacterium]